MASLKGARVALLEIGVGLGFARTPARPHPVVPSRDSRARPRVPVVKGFEYADVLSRLAEG